MIYDGPSPRDLRSEEEILMFLENQAKIRSLENDFSGLLLGFVQEIEQYWTENLDPQ